MWILSVILALLAFASSELLGKKKVAEGNAAAPMEMLVSTLVLAFGLSLVLFASGVGESGKTPWDLLREHPLILANQGCFLMYWLLYLSSFRYIGLAVESAFSGTNGIFYFMGLLLVHTFSGKLTSVQQMLHPARLIPVLVVLAFTFLLPNIEMLFHRRMETRHQDLQGERHRTVTGLLILFAGLLFDAGDTLLTTLIFDEGNIEIVDYVMANHFATIMSIVLLMLLLRKKNGKWFLPFKDEEKYAVAYPCVTLLASLCYLYASSLDAVRTGIVFLADPIFPIIGASVLLKEKYTWRQYLCIWGITIALVAFCAADYIL